MKKSTAFMVAIFCVALSTASYAQLTTTTMKLIKGTSKVNFTAAGVGTSTYTWPQAPSATRPMQSTSGGILSFAPINLGDVLGDQIIGTLGIANGGTGSNIALNNGRIMISRLNAIVEDTAAPAGSLLHGDLSWSSISLTSDISGVLGVANGGTGATTLTQDGILLGNGTGAVTAVALPNNKVLVGNTVGAPTERSFVAGAGIGVSIDASNITISSTLAGTSSARGQASYVSSANPTPQFITIVPGVPVSAASQIFLTAMDTVTHNLIAVGVTTRFDDVATVGSFTVSISTDVDCKINWLIINP